MQREMQDYSYSHKYAWALTHPKKKTTILKNLVINNTSGTRNKE